MIGIQSMKAAYCNKQYVYVMMAIKGIHEVAGDYVLYQFCIFSDCVGIVFSVLFQIIGTFASAVAKFY
jgi:hypothetical protein